MKNRKLLMILLIIIVLVLSGCSREQTAGEKSDLTFGNRNVEIVSWEKNGFVGKECNSGEVVVVNLVTEKGSIEQPDGSIYPECRYGIEHGDTTSREYKKSRMRDNWFLSSYGEWEDKQYDVGDVVYVQCFAEAVYYNEDGQKTIDALGLSQEMKQTSKS